MFYYCLLTLSLFGILRNNTVDCATLPIDCTVKGLDCCACHILFHGLLCGITYNGKAAKIYCAVERNDCAATKLLNNECDDLCGFTIHGNME